LNLDDAIPLELPHSASHGFAGVPTRLAGWENLAFTGEFCEQPDDVVFTVEYSLRGAANAAYGLLGLNREPPAVVKGQHDPRVLYRAFKELHDLK
jgi:oleate hydratase